MHPVPDILLLSERIATDALRTLVARFFEDMVKYVVEVERGMAAVGGELHADAEVLLLAGVRARVRDITFLLIGRGEPLPLPSTLPSARTVGLASPSISRS